MRLRIFSHNLLRGKLQLKVFGLFGWVFKHVKGIFELLHLRLRSLRHAICKYQFLQLEIISRGNPSRSIKIKSKSSLFCLESIKGRLRFNYISMIINQNKISLLCSQNHENQQYSIREPRELMTKTHMIKTKIRFLTERDDQIGFDEYENGKKVIDELPELKCRQLRNRPSLYHHVFNFVSVERHKSPTKMRRREREEAVQSFMSQSYFEPFSPGAQSRSIYTHFLKRNSSEYIQTEGKHRGYSLAIPSLQTGRDQSQKSQIFKRKIARNKYQKTPKIKTGKMKPDAKQQHSAIKQLIKIQKKQINDIKVNKISIKKTSFFNLERKDQQNNRTINSRIQPWGFSHNHNEAYPF